MALPVWPSSVPHKPLADTLRIARTTEPTLSSDMNSGTTRRRRKYTMRVGAVAFEILLNDFELSSFLAFYEDLLGDGSSRFTVPIFFGGAFTSYSAVFAEPPSYQPIAGTNRTRVAISLLVESLRPPPPPIPSPSLLFTGGQNGAWYDPSDLSTLWQNSGRTTPVTADGQPVGCIDDKSGNGYHLTMATSDSRPTYRASGGRHWLDADGINDWMKTVAFTTPITQPFSIMAAAKADSITGGRPLTDGIAGGRGHYPFISTTWQIFDGTLVSTGITADTASHVFYTIPNGGNSTFRMDAGAPVTGLALGGAALSGLSLFSNAEVGGADYWDGRCYGLVIRDTVFTTQERDDLTRWLAAKAGITIWA